MMDIVDIDLLADEFIAEDLAEHVPGYYRNMNVAGFAAAVRRDALAEAAKICLNERDESGVKCAASILSRLLTTAEKP